MKLCSVECQISSQPALIQLDVRSPSSSARCWPSRGSNVGLAEEPAAAGRGQGQLLERHPAHLSGQCQGCHQPAKKGGGYLMTDHASLLLEGDGGLPGIEPGNPDESFLITQIVAQGDKPAKMPKGAPALSIVEVDLIRKWIAEGAVDDSPPSTAAVIDSAHPPVYELPPVISALDFSPDGTAAGRVGLSRGPAAPGRRHRAARSAGRASPSASNRWPFRPTANGWRSPAARRADLAKFRSGTPPKRSWPFRARSPSTRFTA